MNTNPFLKDTGTLSADGYSELIPNVSFDFQNQQGGIVQAQSTIQINTTGGATFSFDLEESVDGIHFATSTDKNDNFITVVGATDAGVPFIIRINDGRARHYRVRFYDITGTLNYEVWKT